MNSVTMEMIPQAGPEFYADGFTGAESPGLLPVAELTPETNHEKNDRHILGLLVSGNVQGFSENSWQWHVVSSDLLASGYPLTGIQSISRLSNNIDGRHNWAAHWDPNNHGMAFYGLHFEDGVQPRDRSEMMGHAVHESAHMVSPFDSGNDEYYGGIENRLAAADYISSVADQTILTEVHLNDYHKDLLQQYKQAAKIAAQQLRRHQISSDQYQSAVTAARNMFNEETGAILHQMALTNRSGLEEKQSLQHKKWEDITRKDRQEGRAVLPKVSLLTVTDNAGQEAEGIDAIILQVLPDIQSYDQLRGHIRDMKQHFYGHEQYQTSAQREYTAQPKYFRARVIHEVGGIVMEMTAEEDERQRRKKRLQDLLDSSRSEASSVKDEIAIDTSAARRSNISQALAALNLHEFVTLTEFSFN